MVRNTHITPVRAAGQEAVKVLHNDMDLRSAHCQALRRQLCMYAALRPQRRRTLLRRHNSSHHMARCSRHRILQGIIRSGGALAVRRAWQVQLSRANLAKASMALCRGNRGLAADESRNEQVGDDAHVHIVLQTTAELCTQGRAAVSFIR